PPWLSPLEATPMRDSVLQRMPLARLGPIVVMSLVMLARSAGADPGVVTWTKLPTETPGPDVTDLEPVVWDSNAGRLLYLPPDEPVLWSLTPAAGTRWSRESIGGPLRSLRGSFHAIFDAARNRVLVFGGRSFGGVGSGLVNETWELSLGTTPTWRVLSTTG